MHGIVGWGSYVPRFRIKVESAAVPAPHLEGLFQGQRLFLDVGQTPAEVGQTDNDRQRRDGAGDGELPPGLRFGLWSHPVSTSGLAVIVVSAAAEFHREDRHRERG